MNDKKRHFLIDLREANKWSQDYVAKRLNMSQQSISFYENGGYIRPEIALKLITLYENKVTLDDFYGQFL